MDNKTARLEPNTASNQGFSQSDESVPEKKSDITQKCLQILTVTLCAISVIVTLLSLIILIKGISHPEKPPSIFGITPVVMADESMQSGLKGSISYGDALFLKRTDGTEIENGDVLAFFEEGIVHIGRVQSIVRTEDDFSCTIKADNLPDSYQTKVTKEDTKFLPYFGDFSIENIDAYMIRQWQNTMITHPENYAPTYLKTLNNQLSAIFNFAVKFYGLSQNPVSVCGTMGKSKSGRLAYWTKEEFDSFIQEIEENSVYHVAFHVLFYSGMREGEFLALTMDDFDFDQNTITINKSYACLKKEDVIQAPKTTCSVRKIVMPQEVMMLVKSYVDRLYGYERTDRVFQTSKMQLLRAMAKGCEKSGVPYIHIHDLRHSHASLLINMGMPPKVVAERLGHENIQTTLNTYSHLYPSKDREVAEKLSDLMSS